MTALIAVAALWLALAKVDIIVTANGRLATSDSAIVIQPLETSVVRSVAVKMGQNVRKGDVLATLDPTFSEADENELMTKLRNLQATYDRLEAELAGRSYKPVEPNPDELIQLDIWRKRQDEYDSRMVSAERKAEEYSADLAAHKIEADGLSQQIHLVDQAVQMYQELVAKSLASKLKLIEATQQLVEAKSRLSTNLGEQQRLQHQIAETVAEQKAFSSEWQRKLAEELAKTRGERDAVASELSKARLRRQMSVLRASSDAIVLDVAERPAGSVVREAEPLMRLVPVGEPLLAEIRVDTRDVARLHMGDAVTIKFEALQWQQFGFARGILKMLAPDTQGNPDSREDDASPAPAKNQSAERNFYYRAQVALTETRFRNLPRDFALRPGMRLVADIKIGRRSVLDFILNPITRVINESLREP
jgi:HlyD family secretion protein